MKVILKKYNKFSQLQIYLIDIIGMNSNKVKNSLKKY